MSIHHKFRGLTLDGSNTKENVALFLTGGHILNVDGWVIGPNCSIEPVEPEASTQAFIKPNLIILHSNAAPRYTKPEALIAYWRRKDINGEAHFQHDLDGRAKQAIPVLRKADCNYKANRFYKKGDYCGAISWESADMGAASLPTTPWTLPQLETFIAFNFLFCVAFDISCQACPTAYSSGIDYHSKFKEWSSFTGKTCPGAARIRQMDYIRNQVAVRLAEFYRQCGGSCPGSE